MNLLIIRHAIAEYASLNIQDKDRPLSPKGRKLFHQFCKQIHFPDLNFELLLTSPLLRSKQTADIFSNYFSIEKTKQVESLIPSANPESFLIELSGINLKSAVIVGHQPFLNYFVNLCLSSSDARQFILLKRGGMAFIEFPLIVKKHSANLKALLDPRYIKI